MKMIPKNNLPNISGGTASVSSTPNFAVDSFGNPHILWIDTGNGTNMVMHKF